MLSSLYSVSGQATLGLVPLQLVLERRNLLLLGLELLFEVHQSLLEVQVAWSGLRVSFWRRSPEISNLRVTVLLLPET